MSLLNNPTQYGSVSKFFHWIIFFLVVCMFFLGYFMGDIENKIIRGTVINIHKVTGITILSLMVLRLFWNLFNVKPTIPNTQLWERILERSGHFLLYFVFFAMPISGWMMSVAAGKPPHFFNFIFNLPLEPNKSLAELCVSIHNTLAIVIIVLVSLHVLAAIYHHVIKKDNVLTRML